MLGYTKRVFPAKSFGRPRTRIRLARDTDDSNSTNRSLSPPLTATCPRAFGVLKVIFAYDFVTMAGITELIRHSPNLRRLHTLRCRHLNGFRDRISDLMDSNRNKQLGLAEVITTIP